MNKPTETLLKKYLQKLATAITPDQENQNLTNLINKTKLEKSGDLKTLLNSLAMFIDFFMVDEGGESLKGRYRYLGKVLRAFRSVDDEGVY